MSAKSKVRCQVTSWKQQLNLKKNIALGTEIIATRTNDGQRRRTMSHTIRSAGTVKQGKNEKVYP